MRPAALIAVLLVLSGCAGDEPERHLFYLHGQIVEGSDGRPVHPEYGVYDYPAIVAALEQQGFIVHSEIRAHNTNGIAYAARLTEEVEALVAEGVAPERISIVGTSKGGGIAVAASSKLDNEGLTFVFMGTCVNWIENYPSLRLRGRILSIVEESDAVAGSCLERFADSDIRPVFREIRIRTNRGHGAFYQPLPDWVEPVASWAMGADIQPG
jgi:hypothetical protein